MTASGHESDEGDLVTANDHDDLPGEQGIAHAVDATGSGQKTAIGHGETGLPEKSDATGSGPKTATARRRTANETRPASDTLDCLTVSGKQSESENDGTGHGSCPTDSGLCDPSLFLDPKIGKHGRIENGSGPPKTL